MMRRLFAVACTAALVAAAAVSANAFAAPKHHAPSGRCASRHRDSGHAAATLGPGRGLAAVLTSTRAARHGRRCSSASHRHHHAAAAPHNGVSTTGPSPSSGTTGSGSPLTGARGEVLAPSSSTVPTEETHTPPPSIAHVQVTSVEYHFTLSRTTVPAGKVAFQFVNNGQDEHNLNVLSNGEGSLTGSFPNTLSKEVRSQTFEMRPGSYTLFCSLPEHESKGMKATLTVE